MADPLTAEDRRALEWYRDGDMQATSIGAALRASLERRYLLIRMTPPGGELHAISPRGLRALGAGHP
jgi:hypothetical protein